eukprot:3926439-Rhodomonas_salina.1
MKWDRVALGVRSNIGSGCKGWNSAGRPTLQGKGLLDAEVGLTPLAIGVRCRTRSHRRIGLNTLLLLVSATTHCDADRIVVRQTLP